MQKLIIQLVGDGDVDLRTERVIPDDRALSRYIRHRDLLLTDEGEKKRTKRSAGSTVDDAISVPVAPAGSEG